MPGMPPGSGIASGRIRDTRHAADSPYFGMSTYLFKSFPGSGKRPDHLPFRHEPLVVWYLGKNLHNRISLLQP